MPDRCAALRAAPLLSALARRRCDAVHRIPALGAAPTTAGAIAAQGPQEQNRSNAQQHVPGANNDPVKARAGAHGSHDDAPGPRCQVRTKKRLPLAWAALFPSSRGRKKATYLGDNDVPRRAVGQPRATPGQGSEKILGNEKAFKPVLAAPSPRPTMRHPAQAGPKAPSAATHLRPCLNGAAREAPAMQVWSASRTRARASTPQVSAGSRVRAGRSLRRSPAATPIPSREK